jgi:hypothetical protein
MTTTSQPYTHLIDVQLTTKIQNRISRTILWMQQKRTHDITLFITPLYIINDFLTWDDSSLESIFPSYTSESIRLHLDILKEELQ